MADNKIGFLNADDMVILNECLSADSCDNAIVKVSNDESNKKLDFLTKQILMRSDLFRINDTERLIKILRILEEYDSWLDYILPIKELVIIPILKKQLEKEIGMERNQVIYEVDYRTGAINKRIFRRISSVNKEDLRFECKGGIYVSFGAAARIYQDAEKLLAIQMEKEHKLLAHILGQDFADKLINTKEYHCARLQMGVPYIEEEMKLIIKAILRNKREEKEIEEENERYRSEIQQIIES